MEDLRGADARFIARDGMYADVQREFGLSAPLALRPGAPRSFARLADVTGRRGGAPPAIQMVWRARVGHP